MGVGFHFVSIMAQPTGFPAWYHAPAAKVFSPCGEDLTSFRSSAGPGAVAAGLLARQGSEAGTEADIAVRIRAGVVEVQRAQPGIGRIVPIAATDRQALIVDARPLLLFKPGLSPS